VIKTLSEHGVYQKDIIAELGVHPKTVSQALKRNGAPKRERKRRGSQLAPYQAKIDHLLSEGVWNVRVILREIQAEGYAGSYSILREYIQPKCAQRPGKATVRFEKKPGDQMQSDWEEIHVELTGRMTKVHFEVNQIGYSRQTLHPRKSRHLILRFCEHFNPLSIKGPRKGFGLAN
jgi:transposase